MATNEDSGHSHPYFVVLLAMLWHPISQPILGISRTRAFINKSPHILTLLLPQQCLSLICERGDTLRLLHCSPGLHGLTPHPNELGGSWDAKCVVVTRGERRGCRIVIYLSICHLWSSIYCKAIKLVLIASMYPLVLGRLGTISWHFHCLQYVLDWHGKKDHRLIILRKKDCHL